MNMNKNMSKQFIVRKVQINYKYMKICLISSGVKKLQNKAFKHKFSMILNYDLRVQ